MHVLDDPTLSDRLRGFLSRYAERCPPTTEQQIHTAMHAVGAAGQQLHPVPAELVDATLAFEKRYGGLRYRPTTADNHMEYGLDGEAWWSLTPDHGWALSAIVDGDWTWPVEVLLDGQTLMAPGQWPNRIIDRCIEQRLEKHALLASVRPWPHRTFTYHTEADAQPPAAVTGIPHIDEASGPADQWWSTSDTAVQLTLSGWPPRGDRWTLRCFARSVQKLPAVLATVDHLGEPDDWCTICSRALRPVTRGGIAARSFAPQGGQQDLCVPSHAP